MSIDIMSMDSTKRLQSAIQRNNCHAVRSILSKHRFLANRALEDLQSDTPLEHAIKLGRIDVVCVLVKEFSSSVDKANPDYVGSKALLLAVAHDQLDTVRVLVVQGGVSVDSMPQDKEFNALLLSSNSGNLEIVRFLVSEGNATVDFANKNGYTALMSAVAADQLEIIKFLVLEGGASTNVATPQGTTALHFAAGCGFLEIVRFLVLEGGASVNAAVTRRCPSHCPGDTPLSIAVKSSHTAVAKFLLRHGASASKDEASQLAVKAVSDAASHVADGLPHGNLDDARETVKLLESKSCTKCGAVGRIKWCDCGEVSYCDRTCQRAHWKVHKDACSATKK